MAATYIHVTDFRTQIPGELGDKKYTWYFPPIYSTSNMSAKGSAKAVNSSDKISAKAANKEMVWQIYVKVILFLDSDDKAKEDGIAENGRRYKFVSIKDRYFDSENEIEESGLAGYIKVDTGFADGKTRESYATIVYKGLNKKNKKRTNAFTQALRDAFSKYNSYLHETSIKFAPMLAKQEFELPGDFDFGRCSVYVQPKLNGVRAIYINGELLSRTMRPLVGKKYLLNELEALGGDMKKCGLRIILDGELYLHGTPLQDITSYSKNDEEENSEMPHLQYHIFDCIIEQQKELPEGGEWMSIYKNGKYKYRNQVLLKIFREYRFKNVFNVETTHVKNAAEIDELYDEYLEQGYEGAMVRMNGPYECGFKGKRSKYLMKKKPWADDEFEVIGYKEGRGKDAGKVIWILKTKSGGEFSATSEGKVEDLKKLYEQLGKKDDRGRSYFETNYLGKMMTVMYRDFSKDGIPLHAHTDSVIREE